MSVYEGNRDMQIIKILVVLVIFILSAFVLYNEDYLTAERNFIVDVLKIEKVNAITLHNFSLVDEEFIEESVILSGAEASSFINKYLKSYSRLDGEFDKNTYFQPYIEIDGYEFFAVEGEMIYRWNDDNEVEHYKLHYNLEEALREFSN